MGLAMAGDRWTPWKRRLAWLSAAALVLLVVAVVVLDPPARHWQRMRARTQAIEARLRAVPTTRVPLNAATSSGTAWEHYVAAFEAMGAEPDHGAVAASAEEAARGDDDLDRALRHSYLTRFATLLDRVQAGARAADADAVGCGGVAVRGGGGIGH